MWKELIALGFIGIMGFVGATFFLSGQPLTLTGFTTYILTGSNNVLSFITEKWQYVLSSVGGIATIAGISYKAVKSKIDTAKQTAETQIFNTQAQATRQAQAFEATIKDQQVKIGELEQKVTDTNQLREQLEHTEIYAKTLERDVEVKAGAIRELERIADPDYVRGLEDTCRSHNLPLPMRKGIITILTQVR